MIRKLLTLLVLLFAGLQVISAPKLSNNSQIVVFTCTPGAELYAGFGHSAIWVSDPIQGIDRLYNYGTFDFNTPNFYWKFIRGRLNYMLSVTTVRRFINEYNHRKIGVTGQTINLNDQERQQLFDLLEVNYQPENRFYKYDFFYDNCATRIRDIVEEAVDGEVNYNTFDQNLSFRQILFPYLEHSPWTKFGINLILGLSSDKIASTNEYMYMPELMQQQYTVATVERQTGQNRLVSKEVKYLDSKLEFKSNPLTSPSIVFGIMFLLISLLTYWELKTGRYQLWLDITLNSIAVLAGLFLFFMWVGTDHSATNQNLNILWLFPAQFMFLLSRLNKGTGRKKLVWAAFGIIMLVSVLMHLWPQETELSFLIITLIFALRYLFHERIVKKAV